MALRLNLVCLVLLCETGCLWEETVINPDFEYIKLTESSIPLSDYFVKGYIRNMPFSYSTNDPFYKNTTFISLAALRAGQPLIFSIGDFGWNMPVWTYIDYRPGSQLIQPIEMIRSFKVGNRYNKASEANSERLSITMVVEYFNPRVNGILNRSFSNELATDWTFTVIESEELPDHFNLTFRYTGKLIAKPVLEGTGEHIEFGEAMIDFRIRVNK